MAAITSTPFKAQLRWKNLRRAAGALGATGAVLAAPYKQQTNELLEKIFAQTQREVPYRNGDLQNSGRIEKAKRISGARLEASIKYGNESVRYAVVQHETPPSIYSHGHGRKWKYVEDPMNRHKKELKQILKAGFRSGLNLSFKSFGLWRVGNIWR